MKKKKTNKKKVIKDPNKNYSEKVKVGEFKTPGEIIRDLINSGAVKALKNGGYLKANGGGLSADTDPPYSGKGGATQRSYSNVNSNIKIPYVSDFLQQMSDTNKRLEQSNKAVDKSGREYNEARAGQFIAESNLYRNFPDEPDSQELRQKYEPNLQNPVDTNTGYVPNLQMKKGGYLKR